MDYPGNLYAVAAPSGTGKSSLVKALLELDSHLTLSISHTTRKPRGQDQQGREYHFVDDATFRSMIAAGEFVEWAEVYGNLYGTPRRPLEEASRRRDRLMLLDIDVQGAAQLRKQKLAAIFIFIAPPSLEELRTRLRSRATDQPDVIEKRLRWAEAEMKQQHLYDHVLVNVDFGRTIAEAKRLLGL
jgi:guanylate kinase